MNKTNNKDQNSPNQIDQKVEKSEFKILLSSFTEAFNLEKGLIPTIRDLIISPFKVIDSYFKGEKKYTGPGKFFAFCIGLFSLTLWLGPKYELSNLINSSFEIDDNDFKKYEIIAEKVTHTLMTSPSGMLISVIPIYSIICWLIFKNRSLSQHFVIQVYSLSLLMGISLLPYIGYFGQTIHLDGSDYMIQLPLGMKIGAYIVSFMPFVYLTYVNYSLHKINLVLSSVKTTLAFGFSFIVGSLLSSAFLVIYYLIMG